MKNKEVGFTKVAKDFKLPDDENEDIPELHPFSEEESYPDKVNDQMLKDIKELDELTEDELIEDELDEDELDEDGQFIKK